MTLALSITVGLLAIGAIGLSVAYSRLSSRAAELTFRTLLLETQAIELLAREENLVETLNNQTAYIEDIEQELVDGFDDSADAAGAFTRLLSNHPYRRQN